jgi:hypothetical protein
MTNELPFLDRPVYGAAAFAEILNRTERQIQHDLEKGRLDAWKWGERLWTSTPRRLLNSVSNPKATNTTA